MLILMITNLYFLYIVEVNEENRNDLENDLLLK